MQEEYRGVVKKPNVSTLYLELLIIRLRDLTDLYSGLLSKYAKIVMDEELFNALLSDLIVTSIHVYYKLKGSGDSAKDLVDEFKDFEPWFDDITIPKTDITEQKKVHRLFRLVLKSYDFLGLSNY